MWYRFGRAGVAAVVSASKAAKMRKPKQGGAPMRVRIPLRGIVVTALLAVVAILTAASLGTVWIVSERTATNNAARAFDNATHRAGEKWDRLIRETLSLADLGATQAPVSGDGLDLAALPFLTTALAAHPALYSVYFGFDDGRFLQVISTRGDENVLAAHTAPAATRWILRSITSRAGAGGERSGRVQNWTFLDAQYRPIGNRTEGNPGYDPTARPWYASAMAKPNAQLSKPYVFNSLHRPGITASKRVADSGTVIGVDITLSGLGTFVEGVEISPHGGLVIFDETGRILGMSANFGPHDDLAALSSTRSPAVEALRLVKEGAQSEVSAVTSVDGQRYLVHREDWHAGGRHIGIAAIAPMADFTGYMVRMQVQIIGLTLLGLALFVPAGLFLAHRTTRVVAELAADANRLRSLNFSGKPFRESRVVEFYELGRAFISMKLNLKARTTALEEAEQKLSRLVELGIALAEESNGDRLMEMIVVGAKEIAHAEGGTLYILREDKTLAFQIFHNERLNLRLAAGDEGEMDFPAIPLFDENGSPNLRNVVSHCVHQRTTSNIADAYDSGAFDFSGTRAFDARTGYQSRSFVTVPLKPRGGDIIGALQLINARGENGDGPVPFSAEIQGFVEALAAQAAVALENRNLLVAQERLMDSLVQLIAGAIDAKSPYTGAHCARVPTLAMMLAEEASNSDMEPFSDFRFETDEEWREFRIGAWLHDCGKVTTPEYVVDKATKLETIYNRVHEVRARFEILLRDAEIDKLKAVAAGGDPADETRRYEARKQELIEDFAFVAGCNIGGEFMTGDDVTRLRSIAKTPWLRHFDNRLGLSAAELKRYPGPPRALPAVERLLDDRPYHVVPRDGGPQWNPEDFGFKMSVPEALYDYGEVANLSISRGTLSAEERFKVNEHIIQTIVMLECLPFPKHLRRVPEYAGTHHEALNGAGYPRKLTEDQLSIPARIMAIADIFEALTASDRPYKKAKTLSEAIEILNHFKRDGHIDPNLFDLFLTSGTCQRYAEQFLRPDQIDDVDIDRYLGPVP